MIAGLLPGRVIIFFVLFLAAIGLIWAMLTSVYNQGYEARQVEELRVAQEKTNAANRANDLARLCALNPACRLQNDGHRRD